MVSTAIAGQQTEIAFAQEMCIRDSDHGVDALFLVVDGVGQTALAPLVDGIDRTRCV